MTRDERPSTAQLFLTVQSRVHRMATETTESKHDIPGDEELMKAIHLIQETRDRNKSNQTAGSQEMTSIEMAEFLKDRKFSTEIIVDAFKKESIPMPESFEPNQKSKEQLDELLKAREEDDLKERHKIYWIIIFVLAIVVIALTIVFQ